MISNNKLKLTHIDKNGELGIIIDNTRKSNYEDILDLFDLLMMNDRESSNSLYIIQDLLVIPSVDNSEDLIKYKFFKFVTVNDLNKEYSLELYKMLKDLIVDQSL